MARIRSIKPELRTSITVSAWPREVRYFFVLLWGYFDDYGRGVDDELLITSDCFPRDRDITPERVDDWLELIADSGPLCRYEVDGRRYLHAPNWREHQKPSHPTRSKIPPCPDDEPDDFKVWRGDNPQRLRNRSRKSREGFQKIPETVAEPSESLSGRSSGATSGSHAHDCGAPVPDGCDDAEDSDEPAGQDAFLAVPEILPNSSGDAPEHFAPEQGSKGAREQGRGGAGETGRSNSGGSAHLPAPRPDGRTSLHTIPDDFHLNDTMRRWSVATFGQLLDPVFETDQFISYWRSEGRRKRNWHDAWQKWMRDSADRKSERAQRGHLRAVSGGQPYTTPEERGIF